MNLMKLMYLPNKIRTPIPGKTAIIISIFKVIHVILEDFYNHFISKQF